jgi:hypothetical protein
MLSAAEQLRHLEDRLLQTGGLLRPDVLGLVSELDRRGQFVCVLNFPSGYELHVHMFVDVRLGYPIWERYAFHLRGPDGRCVFRYDNESHYPAMSTFPHHKHVGPDETPVESHLPTLAQIVTEVRAAVQAE